MSGNRLGLTVLPHQFIDQKGGLDELRFDVECRKWAFDALSGWGPSGAGKTWGLHERVGKAEILASWLQGGLDAYVIGSEAFDRGDLP